MKKQFAALLAALSLLPTLALAQEYYTLPEIKEQAKDGWHETYTDKYGRETAVDIDVEVYGDDKAPILRLEDANLQVDETRLIDGETADHIRDKFKRFNITKDYPYDTVTEVRKKGGRKTWIYRAWGEAIDPNKAYGAEYGSDLTIGGVYDFCAQALARQGLDMSDDFEYAHPKQVEMLVNISQATGQPASTPFYIVNLWQKLRGLPILEHAMKGFEKQGWPMYTPTVIFMMLDENSYDIYINMMKEAELVAEDIPLCSFDTVKRNLEAQIEAGHIQGVLSLQFGYALYNEPGYPNYRKDIEIDYQADYYAVPSWVIECIYMPNGKKTFVMQEDPTPGANIRGQNDCKTLVINAQTGELIDVTDRSKGGFGDADYKGFIPWDRVK